jgi:tetratricopeptide (TPR) repeat protein
MKKILLLCLLQFAFSTHSQNLKSIIDDADKAMNTGNNDKAIASLDKAIVQNPSAYDLFHARGRAYVGLEKFQEAVDDFTKALQLNPKAAEVYNSRGLILSALGYFDEAIVDAENAMQYAVESNEKNVALTIRADVKRLKKDYVSAIKDYEMILAANPEPGVEINCLLSIAKSLGALKRNEEAVAYLERLTKSYPEMTVGFTNLAFRYAEMGNYKKAIELNEKVIALEQKNANKSDLAEVAGKVIVKGGSIVIALAYNNKGYAEYKLGNTQAAMASINHSISLYPENSYAYRNRALVYLALKNNVSACIDIDKALELGFTRSYGDELEKLRLSECK